MQIIGLDISLTDTGISVFNTLTNISNTTHINTSKNKHDDYARKDMILTGIKNEVLRVPNSNIILEDYAFSRTMGKAFTRAEIVGVVKHYCRNVWKVPVYLVKPNVLKKYIVGAGGGATKKAGMKQAVYARYGYLSDNDNCVDAFSLVEYGKAFLLHNEQLDSIKINPIM